VCYVNEEEYGFCFISYMSYTYSNMYVLSNDDSMVTAECSVLYIHW